MDGSSLKVRTELYLSVPRTRWIASHGGNALASCLRNSITVSNFAHILQMYRILLPPWAKAWIWYRSQLRHHRHRLTKMPKQCVSLECLNV